MNRRYFLKRSSIATIASMLPVLGNISCIADSSIPIINTHQHLRNLDMFPLKWVKPPLDRNFLMNDYLEAIEGQGIVSTICNTPVGIHAYARASLESIHNENPEKQQI